MTATPIRIDCLPGKAEGRIAGHPYDTEIINAAGCAFHVWLGDAEATPALLAQLVALASARRVVVAFTWSPGEPFGFWAHEDFGAVAAAPGRPQLWNVTVRQDCLYELTVSAETAEDAINLAIGMVETGNGPEPDSVSIEADNCDAARVAQRS